MADRLDMLAQLCERGFKDDRVLKAMAAVDRERFVDREHLRDAYADKPLPIAAGQTISQPYVVALMASALQLSPHDRVLEVGTGSGYAAAILAELAGEIHSVERHSVLAGQARERLGERVQVHEGDGTHGWPAAAPYDAILVSAGGPEVPASLREQLAPGGRLVMPVGGLRNQQLVLVTRLDEAFETVRLASVSFVPLIGGEGWS